MPAGAHPQATRPPLSISLHAAEQPGESVVSPALSTTDTPLGNGLRSPWPAVFIPISLSLSLSGSCGLLSSNQMLQKSRLYKTGQSEPTQAKAGASDWNLPGPQKAPRGDPRATSARALYIAETEAWRGRPGHKLWEPRDPVHLVPR